MKKLSLITLIIIIASIANAQQLPLYSQYFMNKFLVNPAITGEVDYIPIRLTARQQWVGLDGAPSTQAFSAHKLLNNKRMGVGGYIFADKFGPETKVGIQASYSYKIPLNSINSILSFGIAARAFQYKLDYSVLSPISENDPTLNSSVETAFVPDADFGVFLKNANYYVGLSANQLIELPVEIADQTIEKNSMVRHYYLMGGYTFSLSEDYKLEPSVLVKATEKTPAQLDINVKGIYQEKYWVAVSYRTSKDIVAMLGVKYNSFVFGYAFDFTTSDIKTYSSGSHEIMLGYNFGEGKNKGSSLL
jgi:type IX secretion system PorP/SprF family membrane protein